MSIFDIISLFGGLAMFLFGMRMMGDGLKESSGSSLKRVMEKVSGTPIKAFFLGLFMTALIQSSTATIVITSGLVGAGIISLHQSLGIIMGANVGTTVTGQIIRLLDLNTSGTSVLQFFKPSTLAPLALIIGILLIMSKKDSGAVGRIIIGFGILFTGLMNMTNAVSALTESGLVESMFSRLGASPLLGYLIGLAVSFVLQSSSASIGILQAFSLSGLLTFHAIYPVLMGIYLGDCVTTAIVCNIGAKPDSRRVGVANIAFNLGKTLLIIIGVNLARSFGLIDGLWSKVVNSGDIANANTVFNLSCALLLLPAMGLFEKLSLKLVKDDPVEVLAIDPELKVLDRLNPVFLQSSGLALNACYDVLMAMFLLARKNINRAFDVVNHFDAKLIAQIRNDEDALDTMADRTSSYLMQISVHIITDQQTEIMNHYYAIISEFERLGDHAMNIAENVENMNKAGVSFSDYALRELRVIRDLIRNILNYTGNTFKNSDGDAAQHIEPLEEVVDDMVNALRENHLQRLRQHQCSVLAGTEFLNLLSEIERISDICSNVGVFTIARLRPEIKHEVHDYVSKLHSGNDERFNREYHAAHDHYFALLNKAESMSSPSAASEPHPTSSRG
ncbi:MAG: Na/Pi cotransporter family protein [Clostridia bacterium]|nr:Na/Pi cotransporter family protein [Clostridia bacterium]